MGQELELLDVSPWGENLGGELGGISKEDTSSIFSVKYSELSALLESWMEAEVSTWRAPHPLPEASTYVLLSAGKRIRPVICLATADIFGLKPEKLRAFALAVEIIHTSTLVHDDLPALDDDSLRRGKPSCHVAFGEGAAILIGDFLLAKAFELLSREAEIEQEYGSRLIALLAQALVEVCSGQVLDISEGRKTVQESDKDELNQILSRYQQKTSALLQTVLLAPAIASKQSPEVCAALSEFGKSLGLLFQLTDDILEASSLSTEELGKNIDSDAKHGTLTPVSILGLEGAKRLTTELAERAHYTLNSLGTGAEFLHELISFVQARKH